MDKNDTKMLKSIEKYWFGSLFFLDNTYVHIILVFILFILASRIFYNVNHYVEMSYRYSIIRIIVLLLIIYFFPKSPLLSLLLGIVYVMSIQKAKTDEHFKDMSSSVSYVSPDEPTMRSSTTIPPTVPPTLLLNPPSKMKNPMNMMNMMDTTMNTAMNTTMNMMNTSEEEGRMTQNTELFIPNMMYSDHDKDDSDDSIDEPMDNLNSTDCLMNVPSSYQPVGDLCSSMSVFDTNSDIQGINTPNGYTKMSGYSL